MAIQGYKIGPIACEAAFVADFDVDRDIPISMLVSQIDSNRQTMAARGGMHHKYVPLRFDPATGAHQIGGRYLFETWNDVADYMRFTTEELEFEPGIKFWNRPFFSNIDKRAWRVIGAHDFMPLASHYVSRFERFAYNEEAIVSDVEAAWPAIRDAASDSGLASVWLLVQPNDRQVGLLTAATQVGGDDDAERASRSLTALEGRASLASHAMSGIGLRPLFDRTSLNLTLWLPRSERLGGDASVFPTFPVHPNPQH